MESSTDLKPMISIIVPAMLGYDWFSPHLTHGRPNIVATSSKFSSCAQPGRIIRYRQAMLLWKPDQCCFTRRGPPESAEPQRTS